MPKCMSTYGVKLRLDCWCSCCPGSEKTWTKHEERPSHQIADGEYERIAQDGKRTCLQRAPCVQVFVHLSNRCVDESQERRMSWNPFQKRNRKSSLALVNMILACTRCQFSVLSPHTDLRQEDISALAPPQTTSLCSEFSFTVNSRSVQWVTISFASICWFVPWVTVCFLNQRKNSGKTAGTNAARNCCDCL